MEARIVSYAKAMAWCVAAAMMTRSPLPRSILRYCSADAYLFAEQSDSYRAEEVHGHNSKDVLNILGVLGRQRKPRGPLCLHVSARKQRASRLVPWRSQVHPLS